MPGPNTQGLLEAIAGDLRTRLPALKTCEVHDGRWDAEEVKRWSVATQAVLVAWLGTAKAETPGVRWTDCEQQLAAFVVTRDVPGLGRGAAARALVDWLLLYVPRSHWGLSDIGEATGLRAANLYSRAIDKTGVAMWMVNWRQELRLEAAEDGTCPPLPDELYASAQGDRSVLARVYLAQAARPVRSAVAALKWQSSQQESAESDTSSER